MAVAWDWQLSWSSFLLVPKHAVYWGAKCAFPGGASKHAFDTHVKFLFLTTQSF